MSIPAKMDESKDLEYLDTDWKLATVYTAFLYPKSQQDAIRLIYKSSKRIGDKTLDIRNPANWIIDTREKLMERGYLIRTDNKLKNSIIKADIEPIVQSLIAAGMDGGRDHEVQEGVRLVLDSDWFRNFFSDEFLNNPITYRNGTVYEPYHDIVKENPSWSHLMIDDLKNRLFQLLSEIGYYSNNMRWVLLEEIDPDTNTFYYNKNDPLLEGLLTLQRFDSVIEKYRDLIPSPFIKDYSFCIEKKHLHHSYDFFPERLIKRLLNDYGGLLMPMTVSIFLSRCPYKSEIRRLDFGYIYKEFSYYRRADKRDPPI